jgi:acylphosphatase
MLVSRRYVVRGRVQGVGFRWFTHDAAANEGLHGWVRNLADGSVEVVAEGERDSVDRMETAIRRGPPHARVEQVDIEELPPAHRVTGFEIRP